jgi:hypothetical protein
MITSFNGEYRKIDSRDVTSTEGIKKKNERERVVGY